MILGRSIFPRSRRSTPHGLDLTHARAAELERVRRDRRADLPPLAFVRLIDAEPPDEPDPFETDERSEYLAACEALRLRTERGILDAMNALTAAGRPATPGAVAAIVGRDRAYCRRVMAEMGVSTARRNQCRNAPHLPIELRI